MGTRRPSGPKSLLETSGWGIFGPNTVITGQEGHTRTRPCTHPKQKPRTTFGKPTKSIGQSEKMFVVFRNDFHYFQWSFLVFPGFRCFPQPLRSPGSRSRLQRITHRGTERPTGTSQQPPVGAACTTLDRLGPSSSTTVSFRSS